MRPINPFVAGGFGAFVSWSISHYLYVIGSVSKEWGTLLFVAGTAVPYAVFRHLERRKRAAEVQDSRKQ